MSKFDDYYDIRRLKYEEIPLLQSFIKAEWGENHILARDRHFFEYEYYLDGRVNFLVSLDKKSGKIMGMIGYIQASSDYDHLDIWPTMWKVAEGTLPLLGLELYKRLYDISGARSVLGCGNNQSTSCVMLDVIMKYKNMKMKHYYRVAEKSEYKIAIIDHPCNTDNFGSEINVSDIRISLIESDDAMKEVAKSIINVNDIPYKDYKYFVRRYLNHPKYNYIVWEIEYVNRRAFLIAREQFYNGQKALRIVDYEGDDEIFGKLFSFFSELIRKYEYIDLYEYGMKDECLYKAGFVLVRDNDTNIIPNYFSPFVPRNVEIFVSARDGIGRFFKGDGDQDRPN